MTIPRLRGWFTVGACAHTTALARFSPGRSTRRGLAGVRTTGGFTLIETLVAISVIVVAVIVPLRVVSQAVKSAQFSREKTVATYLAQEGLELVADTVEQQLNNYGTGWGFVTGLASYTSGFSIDPISGAILNCGSGTGTCALYFDSTHANGMYYLHTSSYAATPFTRTMRIRSSGGGGVEVEAVVSWTTSYGVGASVAQTLWLYNRYE